MSDIIERVKEYIDGTTGGHWSYSEILDCVTAWQPDTATDKPVSSGFHNAQDGYFVAASKRFMLDLITEVERLRAELAKQTPPDTVNPMTVE